MQSLRTDAADRRLFFRELNEAPLPESPFDFTLTPTAPMDLSHPPNPEVTGKEDSPLVEATQNPTRNETSSEIRKFLPEDDGVDYGELLTKLDGIIARSSSHNLSPREAPMRKTPLRKTPSVTPRLQLLEDKRLAMEKRVSALVARSVSKSPPNTRTASVSDTIKKGVTIAVPVTESKVGIVHKTTPTVSQLLTPAPLRQVSEMCDVLQYLTSSPSRRVIAAAPPTVPEVAAVVEPVAFGVAEVSTNGSASTPVRAEGPEYQEPSTIVPTLAAPTPNARRAGAIASHETEEKHSLLTELVHLRAEKARLDVEKERLETDVLAIGEFSVECTLSLPPPLFHIPRLAVAPVPTV